MKFTLSWLKQFLDTEQPLDIISTALTDIGLEVENIIDRRKECSNFKVAKILTTTPHPDANKLKICTVETTDGILQIVCGAANARDGIYVVLANIGSIIPNGNFKIKESEIRGIKSSGMLCSEAELMVGTDDSGIIELPQHAKVGEEFAKYYGLDDPVIHINITPNRGDALGVYGIARDLAAKGIGKLKPIEIPQIAAQFQSVFNIKIKDLSACPLFLLREIKGLNNMESPDWIKKLLQNIGVGSISPVVDVTNYIAYSFGHPMHAYDADKISGGLSVEILGHKTKFQALNNKEYELENGDLVIKDQSDIHCLAGIIGGAKSSCSSDTTNIILEAACFNAGYIAKTSRRLQIETDSKYRYERNIDQAFTKNALDLATSMILSICGGQASTSLFQGEIKIRNKHISFSGAFLTKMTGIILNINEIVQILEKLGFKTSIVDKNTVNVVVPTWRHDINIKEDIVEEIARIYGFDKIPTIPLPNAELIKIIDTKQRKVFDIKRVLASYGYNEVVTWSFIDSNTAKLFTDIRDDLTIVNPISRDLNYMRPNLVSNLFKLISKNQARSFKDIGFFEIGPVFDGPNPENEHTFVTIAKCGQTVSKNCHIKPRLINIFDIKSDLESLLHFIGCPIEKLKYTECNLPYYHPTRSSTLQLGKNTIGYFGQVHPLILKHFDIKQEVFVFEINLDRIPLGKPKFGQKGEFKASDFQSVTRDFAFVIDIDKPVGEVLLYIKNIDKNLIKSVELFDIYSGDNLEDGKKSIALSITMQAIDRTLTDIDLNTVSNLIITSMEQKFSATLRQ